MFFFSIDEFIFLQCGQYLQYSVSAYHYEPCSPADSAQRPQTNYDAITKVLKWRNSAESRAFPESANCALVGAGLRAVRKVAAIRIHRCVVSRKGAKGRAVCQSGECAWRIKTLVT